MYTNKMGGDYLKKAAKVFFIISCLLFALFIVRYPLPVTANPMTWTVNDDASPIANFTKIQNAIDVASSGDIIFVYAGTYYENIVVNKSLTIIGEDRDFTIIDGAKNGTVAFIKANSVTLEGFTIKNSGSYPYVGVHVDRYFFGNLISNNKIMNNSEGISVYSSSANVISNNIISNNSEGITISFSINNVVSDNLVISNGNSGIDLYLSSSNTISGNTLQNNLDGVSAYFSSGNVISNNMISDNHDAGLIITLSSRQNLIFHNNFNNIFNVLTDPDLENSWDYGGEGNYWSDYGRQDLNGDGIGDFPYNITVNNQDNYPLMGTFSTFSIVMSTKEYSVTIISNSTVSDLKFKIGDETGNKIISYNVLGANGLIGFSRIMIPLELMAYPYFVLVDGSEIIPTLLNLTSESAYLYFTYPIQNLTISVVSSRTMQVYFELLTQYLALQQSFNELNITLHGLLEDYSSLLGNYSRLLESLNALNASYQQHLLDYAMQMENNRSLMYIFAVAIAVFMVITVYLSRSAHGKARARNETAEER